jgi:hypothetical protein
MNTKDLSLGIQGEDGDIIKSGTATILAGTASIAVLFTTAFTTGTYRVVATYAANPGASVGLAITLKATTGFTINSTAVLVGNTAVEWMAYRYA